MVEEEAREPQGIVTNYAVDLEQIARNATRASALDFCRIENDRLGTLRFVTARNVPGNGAAVHNNGVNELTAGVLFNGFDVIAQGKATRFAGLGHQIRDVNAG